METRFLQKANQTFNCCIDLHETCLLMNIVFLYAGNTFAQPNPYVLYIRVITKLPNTVHFMSVVICFGTFHMHDMGVFGCIKTDTYNLQKMKILLKTNSIKLNMLMRNLQILQGRVLVRK